MNSLVEAFLLFFELVSVPIRITERNMKLKQSAAIMYSDTNGSSNMKLFENSDATDEIGVFHLYVTLCTSKFKIEQIGGIVIGIL